MILSNHLYINILPPPYNVFIKIYLFVRIMFINFDENYP